MYEKNYAGLLREVSGDIEVNKLFGMVYIAGYSEVWRNAIESQWRDFNVELIKLKEKYEKNPGFLAMLKKHSEIRVFSKLSG